METLIGGVIGFLSFTLTSHPRSPLAKKIPNRKLSRFQIAPEIKVELKNRFIHLHHWIIFIAVYGFILTSEKALFQADLFQGFIIGSIAQGLTFEDRFMVIYSAQKEKIRGRKLLIPARAQSK